MMPNQHVVPHGDKWAVRGAGNDKVTRITETKREATDTARQISRNQGTELFIHGRDGRIQSRDSHGNDPYPPRG
ncbi:DUF2188 domain-containing protein [Cohnella endophytica]|uniref:DUF2188 domain-containing protein n=2 Tax=Cohnella endophytica TaxID=2419778 RepID=A0A494XEJ2_9BACL|nr:DUF2188 domain-containing protein [Cohnella endophytica]